MEKAMQLLRDNGYDAYVEHGHLYYRPVEGGVVAVMNETHIGMLIEAARTSKDKEHIKLLWDKLDSFGIVCTESLGGDDKWHLHTCEAGFINGVRESCEDDCAEIAVILKETAYA